MWDTLAQIGREYGFAQLQVDAYTVGKTCELHKLVLSAQ